MPLQLPLPSHTDAAQVAHPALSWELRSHLSRNWQESGQWEEPWDRHVFLPVCVFSVCHFWKLVSPVKLWAAWGQELWLLLPWVASCGEHQTLAELIPAGVSPSATLWGHERMGSCPVQAPCFYRHSPLQLSTVTDNPLFTKSSRLSQFSFSWLSLEYLEQFASCTILKLYPFLASITSYPLNILLSNELFPFVS